MLVNDKLKLTIKLTMIPPIRPRPITIKQASFCHHRLNGNTLFASYGLAGYSMNARKDTIQAAAQRLSQIPRVKAYLKEIQEALWEKEALSLAEKRAYLAKAVRTPISEITKESPLAQEYTPTEFGPKIKAISKLEAINLDSKLAGHFQQESSSQNPFQFLVALNLNIASDPLHSTVIEI